MNLTSLLALIVSSTLVYSAPLILASLGGVYIENSCVVNIGLEDIMSVGAFTSIIFNLTFAQDFGAATPWLGALVGAIFGLIFSITCICYNQPSCGSYHQWYCVKLISSTFRRIFNKGHL